MRIRVESLVCREQFNQFISPSERGGDSTFQSKEEETTLARAKRRRLHLPEQRGGDSTCQSRKGVSGHTVGFEENFNQKSG